MPLSTRHSRKEQMVLQKLFHHWSVLSKATKPLEEFKNSQRNDQLDRKFRWSSICSRSYAGRYREIGQTSELILLSQKETIIPPRKWSRVSLLSSMPRLHPQDYFLVVIWSLSLEDTAEEIEQAASNELGTAARLIEEAEVPLHLFADNSFSWTRTDNIAPAQSTHQFIVEINEKKGEFF